MSSAQQHPSSLDPTEDFNQILRDFERENAHIFAPPIETPPVPNYGDDFLFNEFITPTINIDANGNGNSANQYGGIAIQSSQHPPPAPPPSLAVTSPLAAGPPPPLVLPQQLFGLCQTNQTPPACQPVLIITEQPVERCRFRYKAEQGPHGALRGVSGKRQKSSPKVKVENVRGKGYVVASLWTNEEIPRPHINELWGSDCENGYCRIPLDPNTMTVSFPNLGIMRQKEKEVGDILYEKYIKEYEVNVWTVTDDVKESLREKSQKEMATMKDCLHCVRVGFQAFITDVNNKEYATPIVLSSPVFNSQNPGFSELRIAELDKSYGSCLGGDTVWMRCAAKIRRDQIKIKFHEVSSGWEVEATFSPNEVYEQILIIFKTPPYRDTNIGERAHVNIHLYRTTDGEYSAPVDFVYLPVDDGPIAKRPRRMIPTFGPDGFGYMMYHQIGTPQAPSSNGSANDNSCSPHTHTPESQWSGYMSQNSSTGFHQNRKRHMPMSASRARPVPSFDSGIDVDSNVGSQSATGDEPLRSRIEQLTIAEVGRLNDTPKVQKYLCSLWEAHVRALWDFGTEGDPEPLVGACKHLIGLQDEHGNTALHITVRSKQPFALKTMLKVLDDVPNKAQIINLQNYRKQTALHLAVRYGDADCVHYLMKSGADRSVVDCDGMNAVHYLADTFNEAIYRDVLFPPKETIVTPIDLDLSNNEGANVLHLAIKRKKLALLESLLEAKASLSLVERNTGKSSLHMAAESGDVDIIEVLLQNNVDIDKQMYDGTTPLQIAVKSKQEAAVARLVAAGAHVNAKTSHISEEPVEEGAEEVLTGESTVSELQSAMDLASGDENIIALLNGKPYVMPQIEAPSSSAPDTTDFDVPGPSTGARPKTIQRIGPVASSVHASVSSDSMPETVPASLRDDLSSLDFVTRLRLGKLLDKDSYWEQLAVALNCEHMIEFIKVCSEAENSSPTVLLLDQYEQLVHPTITRLLNALEEIGLHGAIELIVNSQTQQRQQMEKVATNQGSQPTNEDVSMD